MQWRSNRSGEVGFATRDQEFHPVDQPDHAILNRIGDLIEEENELRNRHRGTKLSGDEMSRLDELEVQLDQCWDLLNQRRALREFGMDPDQASARDEGTVEGYQQ